jgi:glutamate dehydrogenase
MESTILKSNSEKKILDKLTKPFESDKKTHTYASIFLQTLSHKSLKKQDSTLFTSFIHERAKNLYSTNIEKGFLSLNENKKNNEQISFSLEIIFPDAPYLIVTLEAILNAKNIHITQLYHPIFTVKTNKKGTIDTLESPVANTQLVSHIYLEFTSKTGDVNKKELLEIIERHINAAQSSHKDNKKIMETLMSVKNEVSIIPSTEIKFQNEWVDLLDWLKNHNFSFFGYTSFNIQTGDTSIGVSEIKGSSKGILSDQYEKYDPKIKESLMKHSKRLAQYRSPFIFDTISRKSPLQRFENLMRLSLKIPISRTTTVEHNFIGLLKQSSLLVKNLETPIIRRKMQDIFEHKHLIPGSYDFNQIIRFFTSTPKFELFRTPTENLLELANDLLSITNPSEIYCFTRKKIQYSRPFLLVCIPTEIFTHENKCIIRDYLNTGTKSKVSEIIEAKNESFSRLHIYFKHSESNDFELDLVKIENDIRELVQPWDEKLRMVCQKNLPLKEAHSLFYKWANKFPDHYKTRRNHDQAFCDIQRLENMIKTQNTQFDLMPFYSHESTLSGRSSVLFIYNFQKIDLISIMPIIEDFGIHIYDELTTRIGTKDEFIGYIHTFRIADSEKNKISEENYRDLIVTLLEKIFKGEAIKDPLNALVFSAKLGWKAIKVIQAYRAFYLQLNTRYSKETINNALLNYPDLTKQLWEYFEEKFSPEISKRTAEERNISVLKEKKQLFIDTLISVDDIDSDVIFRRFLSFLEATLRTNFYITKQSSETFLSFKFDSQKIKLPLPIPYREIFVFDPEMEGCHLRFGSVARGGLRWSDRTDDFRREVLGLVKAQQTKNVVIVPVGSKGGFVIKKALKNKEEAEIESKRQYKKFIRGLLDITDNLDSNGSIIFPNQVLRYDDADPYLVVAADKGTAQFSDIANEISNEFNCWLGDGFASGGSKGYNHKVVGITAKGGWECVKLHFQEIGINIQKESFTVAGIGDMSGDVFGNGMLLSKFIKLQAAFNHMHIFIDPSPDTKTSYKERERLFKLPRSTWTDYTISLISKGGGIFERRAKSIVLSKEIKSLLGIKEDAVSGEQLVTAILKMNVDLLWFGGIGTYIKNESETHFQVGDPANDSVRINNTHVNARVIGEGANLGVTMSARIAMSQKNIKLNTDFIDNSAGVNMSDYEVNIKILLKRLLMQNIIKNEEERNTILEKATDEVTALVLENNKSQHQLISMDEIRSRKNLSVFHKLIQHLISEKILNPAEEILPDHAQIEDLASNQKPIPRPTLSTLQSYTKMHIQKELTFSTLAEHQELQDYYIEYLPKIILKKFSKDINEHYLKKEIITTAISNTVINQAGITFIYQTQQITGKSTEEIILAYIIADKSISGSVLRNTIKKSTTSMQSKYEALIELDERIQELVIDILQLPNTETSFELVPIIKNILDSLDKKVKPSASLTNKWVNSGFSNKEAKQIAFTYLFSTLSDILYFQQQTKLESSLGLHITAQLDTVLKFDWIKSRLSEIPSKNQWELSQKDILSQTIRIQKTNLLKCLIQDSSIKELKSISSEKLEQNLKDTFKDSLDLYFRTLKQLQNSQVIDLAGLTVTINRLNFLNSL